MSDHYRGAAADTGLQLPGVTIWEIKVGFAATDYQDAPMPVPVSVARSLTLEGAPWVFAWLDPAVLFSRHWWRQTWAIMRYEFWRQVHAAMRSV